jgi:hypothetical protein
MKSILLPILFLIIAAWSQYALAADDGVQTMVINDATVLSNDMSVRPHVKYKLTLTSSFSGDVESIEENPHFEIFTHLGSVSPVLPSRKLEFLTAEGETIDSSLQYAMPFRDEHVYQDMFYSPDEAAYLRVHIASGDGVRLSVHNLMLEEAADESAVNVNPSFELGPMNYSGWKNIARGGKIITHKGTIVFDTKYGSRGQAFPLQGPGTYALSAEAESNGYNSCVQVHLFDAEGELLLKVSTREYGPARYFVPPPEAVTASLLVYSCLLEEVRLVRVGDENKINTLRE